MLSPLKAAGLSFKRLLKIGGSGEVIAINPKGQFAILHSTKYMAAGYANKKGIVVKEGFGREGK